MLFCVVMLLLGRESQGEWATIQSDGSEIAGEDASQNSAPPPTESKLVTAIDQVSWLLLSCCFLHLDPILSYYCRYFVNLSYLPG